MRPDQTHQTEDVTPALPTLQSGISLLEAPDASRRQTARVIQALVVDHLLLNRGRIEWVDVGGCASTHPLASLVPSERSLERINVARAFTPHQHASLIDELAERVTAQTTLVVCPAVDRFYRESECQDDEGQRLLLRAVAQLSTIARTHDVPVLVTRTTADEFAAPIERAASECLKYEETQYGPRFTGNAFETLVYPVGRGQVQTTLAFWQQVLADRQALYTHSNQVAPVVG
ncbi:hypothetical protein [Halomarina ordinaria]|uniref:DNA recombination and repair protein Rad51-like C-terminal domain-containing protein n=1 Tax=Halomarina ordinaria TaxID=3033939 RepID=A0ABD5UHN9_9EURY|nr:hypothetical protein [Halomarina sp. PSRA2]